jgi:hypothetical protein
VYQGGDFGFCGQSYQAPMALQNAEDTINWYLERDPTENPKEKIALLGCPGLNAFLATKTGQVRGAWVLPGSQQALVVTDNTLYLIKITVPATATSIPQYSSTAVGTLLTNSGPVVMRDNGVLQNGLGGYCLIVDGTYGYYYLLSGTTYNNSFAASAVSGSSLLTFPGSLPNGLIISSTATLSDSGGVIPAGTTVSSVDTIGLTLTMSVNATGNFPSDTVTLSIPPFGQILDDGFLGAQRIAFIEGWLILNQPGSRTFYTTGPTPYSMLFPGLFFSLKDSSTDNLITLMEQDRELWLIGERTSEVWYNGGGANFAFYRIPGIGPQIGCAAVHSIARCGPRLVWLGRNEQGQNVIVCTEQYSWQRISTHAIEHAISSYPLVSDAIGYGYEEEGHLFYMLTFPTADVTWCFDFASDSWHKRLSFDPVGGIYHRHRSNCFMDFGNVRIVGDYQTGYLMQMSRNFYADTISPGTTNPLRALRRTPHVWSKQNRERLFFAQLQIEFTPGVGLQTGQGSNPQVMLRLSDDGSFTWSNEMWTTIGAAGETRNRAIWYQLGRARDRVWEAVISDPVPRDVIGATLYAE